MTALALILDAVERFPDRVAIEESDGNPVTYRALLERARGFAARVRGAGVVEVSAVRTADFVARCLGAWIAERAWTPLDPGEPAARREAIRVRVAEVTATDLAYVIPTSGSSGAPKVVMIGHGGLAPLLRAQIAAFQLAPGDRALWLHAPIFDASISDWGTALAAGATLVVPAVPHDLTGELARRAITHVDLPPVMLASLAVPPPSLRVVILGGEACPVERVRALARRVRVVVVYGPTEATVCASLVAVDPAHWSRPLIGDPLPGVRFRVVDGELLIGGACLALGYAGDPAETARRFVDLPAARDRSAADPPSNGGREPHRVERWYRTGDRVELMPDGLAFVGRMDRQRKVRGRRVELDEIDTALRALPGVRDAATELRGPVLVAFVDGEGTPDTMRAALRVHVPAWMVPARVIVGPLPRTATGKIDHAALAVRPLLSHPPADADPLATELATLWCDALGVEAVASVDRFREAGGDSLAAMTLGAAIAARALALEPAFLTADRTFAELVSAVRTKSSGDQTLTVFECERRGLAAFAACMEVPPRPRPGQGVTGSVGSPPPDSAGLARRSGHPPTGSRVLVTGASGLLGSHLARSFPGAFALVREADRAPAGTEAIVGDLAQPWLGLGPEDWERLVREVGTIVHLGARVALSLDWEAHAATNVDGTAWVARLGAEAGARWHHASTLAVFVGTDRASKRTSRAEVPEAGARAFGGYAQTKLAAEAIARARGAQIYRFGSLVEDAPREGTQLGMVLRGLVKLGAVPPSDPALAFDVTPVAYAGCVLAARVMSAMAAPSPDPRERAGAATPTFVAPPPATPATLSPSGRIPRIDAPHTAPATLTGGMPRIDVPNAAPNAAPTTGALPRAPSPPTDITVVTHIAGRRATFTDLLGTVPVLPAPVWAERARAHLADPDIAMAYLSLARLHGDVALRGRARPFDLFLATGMDFDAEPLPAFDVAAVLASIA